MGHHGSETSTSKEWVEAINPEISVYSAGENKGYRHPGLENSRSTKQNEYSYLWNGKKWNDYDKS